MFYQGEYARISARKPKPYRGHFAAQLGLCNPWCMKKTTAVFLLIASTAPAAANPFEEELQRRAVSSSYTAGDFEKGCALVDVAISDPARLSAPDRAAASACTFYFLGVSESLAAASHLGAQGICPPEPGLRTSDIVEKFKAFVRQNPDSRTAAVMPVTIAALMKAYPCTK